MQSSRDTVQRQLVLEAVQALKNHPSAEEVYAHVACRHPTVSKATVYRNLARLAGQGKVRRVSHLNAADRFDFNLEDHYHFICERCGRVFDAALPYMGPLAERIGDTGGFVYNSCEVTFRGYCPACK